MPALPEEKSKDVINAVREVLGLDPLEAFVDHTRFKGPNGRKLTFKQLTLLVCLYARRVTCPTPWATTTEIREVTKMRTYNTVARTLQSLERQKLVEHRDIRVLNGMPLQYRLRGQAVTYIANLLV